MVVWELKSPGDPLTGTGKSWVRRVINLIKQRQPMVPPEPEVPPEEGLLTLEQYRNRQFEINRSKLEEGVGTHASRVEAALRRKEEK